MSVCKIKKKKLVTSALSLLPYSRDVIHFLNLVAFELHYRAEKFIEQKTVKIRKQNNKTKGKQTFYLILKLYSCYQQSWKDCL